MTGRSSYRRHRQSGMVMVIAMIFIVIFSALAMSLATTSGTHAQIAVNQIHANRARACAESGLEVLRYGLAQVTIPATTASADRLSTLATALQTEFTNQGMSQITASFTDPNVVIPTVYLNDTHTESFSATLRYIDPNLCLEIQGTHDSIQRKIQVRFVFSTQANPLFDFGVATRGPLKISGSTEIADVNVMVTSNTYIESIKDQTALTITSAAASIDGEVRIANPLAMPDIHQNATIGGDTGDEALEHIHIGVPMVNFPTPDPGLFKPYVDQNLAPNTVKVNGKTTPNVYTDAILENVRVPKETYPKFTGQTTINGVLFIETPNTVEFEGGVTVTGVIVGNGDFNDNSLTNWIKFRGNSGVKTENNSYPVIDLLDPKFAGLKDKTGTFILAPGFFLDLGGNFKSISGTIAGNGISLQGNAGLSVRGSIINYNEDPNSMNLGGNSSIHLNRSGLSAVPAGFANDLVLTYDSDSYRESSY